jgi:hypothetical protein
VCVCVCVRERERERECNWPCDFDFLPPNTLSQKRIFCGGFHVLERLFFA